MKVVDVVVASAAVVVTTDVVVAAAIAAWQTAPVFRLKWSGLIPDIQGIASESTTGSFTKNVPKS